MKSPRSIIVAPLAIGFLLPLATSYLGCKKDEPPPPLPSAAPAATPTPAAPLELAPEPVASASASASATPKAGGGGSAPSLAKCCSALIQNAASAPPPNNLYMTQAGQLCQAMVSAGQGSGAILSAIAGKLGGGNMPTACR